MKIFLTVALPLLCGISTMAQHIALPAIYKGQDVISSTSARQLKPLHANNVPVIKDTLASLTGRFLKDYCMSRGPFNFVTVTAERTNGEKVALQFETMNEYSSNSFTIERVIARGTEHTELLQPQDTSYVLLLKTGALGDFDEVNKKYARNKGATKVKYELSDDNNYTGISFYRITELGYDQTTVSSRIVAVMGTALKESIALFPNPAVSQATAAIYSKTTAVGRLQILNNQGTIVKELPVNIASGANNLAIPVSGLAAGSYFIRVIRKDSLLPLQTQFIKM